MLVPASNEAEEEAGFIRMTYTPDQETRDHHQPGLDALATIRDNLPPMDDVHDIEGNPLGEDSGDYPCLASSECMSDDGTLMMWYAEFNRRAIFCIEGVPYFQRYNNGWNSLVMKGELTGKNVSWGSGLRQADLIALAKSVKK